MAVRVTTRLTISPLASYFTSLNQGTYQTHVRTYVCVSRHLTISPLRYYVVFHLAKSRCVSDLRTYVCVFYYGTFLHRTVTLSRETPHYMVRTYFNPPLLPVFRWNFSSDTVVRYYGSTGSVDYRSIIYIIPPGMV